MIHHLLIVSRTYIRTFKCLNLLIKSCSYLRTYVRSFFIYYESTNVRTYVHFFFLLLKYVCTYIYFILFLISGFLWVYFPTHNSCTVLLPTYGDSQNHYFQHLASFTSKMANDPIVRQTMGFQSTQGEFQLPPFVTDSSLSELTNDPFVFF